MKNRIASTGVIGKIASILESKTTKALRRIIEETDAARPADDADPSELSLKNLTEEELALDDSTVTKESEDNDEMSDDELDELMSEEDEDDTEEVDESDDEDEDDTEEVDESDDEDEDDTEEVDESSSEWGVFDSKGKCIDHSLSKYEAQKSAKEMGSGYYAEEMSEDDWEGY